MRPIEAEELQRYVKYVIGLYISRKPTSLEAASAFENIINCFLPPGYQHNDSDKLTYKIDKLKIAHINSKYKLNISRGQLKELNDVRNKIVHSRISNKEPYEETKKLVEFIWKVARQLTNAEFEEDINSIDGRKAYHWVRNFENGIGPPVSNPPSSQGIGYNDFQDLMKMHEKFRTLKKFLDVRKRLKKYPDYMIDDITSKQTAVAYVWLAIVERSPEPRKKIYGSSISVLATPLEIRIYLDFGGLAFKDRKKYLEFLQNNELDSLEMDTTDLFIFDIIWYSYILEKWEFKKYINTETLKEKAKKSYDETVKESESDVPLTWNKLLIGYIIKRESITDDNLSFEIIWSKICTIIELYKNYCNYCSPKKIKKPTQESLIGLINKHKL